MLTSFFAFYVFFRREFTSQPPINLPQKERKEHKDEFTYFEFSWLSTLWRA